MSAIYKRKSLAHFVGFFPGAGRSIVDRLKQMRA